MNDEYEESPVIHVDCLCGHDVEVPADRLGRLVRCPNCHRYLRPALHFAMMEPALADNLTVLCTCGRLVVTKPSRVGKTVTCRGCKQKLALPNYVYRAGKGGLMPIAPRTLKRRMGRSSSEERKPEDSPLSRLSTAAQAGKITLRPGENICSNPKCGALLPPGAMVCPKCGTNFLTGTVYSGAGPADDPVGKWKGPP